MNGSKFVNHWTILVWMHELEYIFVKLLCRCMVCMVCGCVWTQIIYMCLRVLSFVDKFFKWINIIHNSIGYKCMCRQDMSSTCVAKIWSRYTIEPFFIIIIIIICPVNDDSVANRISRADFISIIHDYSWFNYACAVHLFKWKWFKNWTRPLIILSLSSKNVTKIPTMGIYIWMSNIFWGTCGHLKTCKAKVTQSRQGQGTIESRWWTSCDEMIQPFE